MAEDFKSLRVWQQAHRLTLLVYQLTEGFPRDEVYGLTSQLRRAAVSVEANIAEGYGRYHYADEINFFIISRGSCAEVQTLLLVARDLKYASENSANIIISDYISLSKQINSYIRAKRAKSLRGKD